MNTARGLRAFQRTFEQAFRFQNTTRAPHARSVHIAPFRKQHPSLVTVRYQSTSQPEEEDRPLTDRQPTSQESADEIAARKALSPAYQLWFTCKKCLERSGHTISKQAYHFGTCLIECPKCKGRHLISDNLKIFGDGKVTLEEIARQHGEKLRKGRLGAEGDVEFYDEEAEEKIREAAQDKRLRSDQPSKNGDGS
ncbi:related to mitochondrial import Zim17 [Lecanosticta acicola]|uniref:Related to mitochondrial import Zim17 n=1 Tax=Lecanosticta acicola TaxID=111012 RepID=A0AAI8YV68_9PEZI|nr:related to mitochondrial import Zim17 [Lecanosticta acicola]